MAESAFAAGARHERNTPVSTTTGRIELPVTEFALSDLFERVPDAQVELEPAVAVPDDHALLGVEARKHEGGAVENALRADPTVETVECLGRHTANRTYRVTWDGHARRFIERIIAEDTTLLSARARNGRWRFRLVAPGRDAFASAYDAIEAAGYEPECRSIATFEGEQADRSSLTDPQRTALVTAFKEGYYDIPRDTTADEVADELGISHQALSERFRRAYRHIIEHEFAVGEGH